MTQKWLISMLNTSVVIPESGSGAGMGRDSVLSGISRIYGKSDCYHGWG